MELNKIYNEDCLSGMCRIPSESIDMIFCDLPYGTLKDKRTNAGDWDKKIPLTDLWQHYERIIKEGGAIVLSASQPFSSELVMSNKKLFRYEWIWDKKIPSGMAYARFQPMRQHESVLVFCKKSPPYNPQMTKRDTPIKSGGLKLSDSGGLKSEKFKPLNKTYDFKNPITIIPFDKIRKGAIHPTQKPVPLLEYLIKTYTNEGDTVLDNCMGSGSTAIACINTGRNFIGFEKDTNFYNRSIEMINDYLGIFKNIQNEKAARFYQRLHS